MSGQQHTVIPAKAGIHASQTHYPCCTLSWMLACAGMTEHLTIVFNHREKLNTVPSPDRLGYVLGTEPEADQSRGNARQKWQPRQQPQQERRLDLARRSKRRRDDGILNGELQALGGAGREIAARLHCFE